ncbi:hypothetical protein SAMN04488527_1123 [Aliiroseovarius crassostreae]|nr:hypothetical protein SAMN04488527_1123 [Aliiroseovarius crassostreae]
MAHGRGFDPDQWREALAVACGQRQWRHTRHSGSDTPQHEGHQALSAQAIAQFGQPRAVTTDKLRGSIEPITRQAPGADHWAHKGLNNRIKGSHRPTWRRDNRLRGFGQAAFGQMKTACQCPTNSCKQAIEKERILACTNEENPYRPILHSAGKTPVTAMQPAVQSRTFIGSVPLRGPPWMKMLPPGDFP